MIRLSLTIDEVDYDRLLEEQLPALTEVLRRSGSPVGMLLSNGMPAALAKSILRNLSTEEKETLICDLINGSSDRLVRSINRLAEEKGIPVHTSAAAAERSNTF